MTARRLRHLPIGPFSPTASAMIHLCDGLVMDYTIECPKHNGLFDYRTGEALRAPVCVNLKTYTTKVEDGRVSIEI